MKVPPPRIHHNRDMETTRNSNGPAGLQPKAGDPTTPGAPSRSGMGLSRSGDTLSRRALLGATLLASGCGARRPESVTIDPALLSMVPKDSMALMGLRVEEIKKGANWPLLKGQKALGSWLDAMQDKTGFDLRNDIYELLWSWNLDSQPLLFVRNRVNTMELEPTLKKQGIVRMAYKGYPMIGSPEYAALFLNTSAAVVGPTDRIQQLVDDRESGKLTPNPELRARMEALPGNTQFWFLISAQAVNLLQVTQNPGGLLGNVLANLNKFLEGSTWTSAAFQLRQGMGLDLAAECPTAEVRDKLANQWQGVLAMAGAMSKADLRGVLQKLRVETADNSVHLLAQMDQKELETLATSWGAVLPRQD